MTMVPAVCTMCRGEGGSIATSWPHEEHHSRRSHKFCHHGHLVRPSSRGRRLQIHLGSLQPFYQVGGNVSAPRPGSKHLHASGIRQLLQPLQLPPPNPYGPGRNFESALKEMCGLTGVSKSRTTPFHPRFDGLTERANCILLQMLRVTCEGDPTSWPSRLPTVLSAYRVTRRKATGVASNMAMLGREAMLLCSLIAALPDDNSAVTVPFVEQHRDNLHAAHALA